MEVQNLIWECKDGTKLRLGDMTDRHLNNSIRHQKRMVEKWEHEADCSAGYSGNGDEANRAAEQSMDHAFNRVQQCQHNVNILSAERHRRDNMSAIEVMQEAQGV